MQINTMQIDEITSFIAASNFVLTWGIAFYVHVGNKTKVTSDRMERLEAEFGARLATHADRLIHAESTLALMPNHDDLSKLSRDLNETTNMVSRLAGELSQMNDNLRMLLHNMNRPQ
jgi:hypothetical protein